MKIANNVSSIFFAVLLLILIAAFIKVIPGTKSSKPLENMKNMLHLALNSEEIPLKIEMRLADPDELNQPSIYDRFRNIKSEKPESYPVEITGQLSARRVILAYLPVYPKWAKKKNLLIDAVILFHVTPGGHVSNTLNIVETSGYEDVDALAKEAIRKWTFEPIDGNTEQSGQVTFRFKL